VTVERYLLLALRLGRLDDGVIDAYFGPPELSDRVEAEPPATPSDLVTEADALLEELPDGWLRDQVGGLRTYAGILAGERWEYADEVEACYGIRPERSDPDSLTSAHQDLEALLPGPGPLIDRYLAWQRSLEVPAATIEPLMTAVIDEARVRTRELTGLPTGESITVEYVHDVPWLGYLDYLGDLHGRMSVNVDLPRTAVDLLHLALHESYPGHQAERVTKEVSLVRERGLLEETVTLVPAPQAVVSEGLAELAPELMLDGEYGPAFEAIVRDAGIDLDLAHARAVERAAEPLRWVQVDAALMLHAEGRSEAEVGAHVHRWGLVDADVVAHVIRFVTDPTSRSYAICYPAGLQRCRAYVGQDADRPWARFRTLLTEQVRVRDLPAPVL
jgi:hypothetical protein